MVSLSSEVERFLCRYCQGVLAGRAVPHLTPSSSFFPPFLILLSPPNYNNRFIIGLGIAIGFAAAVPKLGATGGYIQAQYSVKLPAIIIIFIISGLGLKTKALLTAAGDLRIHFLVQVGVGRDTVSKGREQRQVARRQVQAGTLSPSALQHGSLQHGSLQPGDLWRSIPCHPSPAAVQSLLTTAATAATCSHLF
jgi:hypothetical protein